MGIQSFQYDGVNYRMFTEPLDLDELFELNIDDLKDPDERMGFHQPMIEDFRQVRLNDLKPSDLRRYLLRVKNSSRLPDEMTDNFVVVIPSDIEAYGQLRLYGIYSDIYGVRSEGHFHVAATLSDAVAWLAGKNGLPPDFGPAAKTYFEMAAQGSTTKVPSEQEAGPEHGSNRSTPSFNSENGSD